MNGELESLSERERETLRLLGRGHDAKSIATALGLSVHTVNERLRDVRRKLGVSSSREAARLLLAHEAAPERPDNRGDKEIGVALDPSDGAYSSGAHSGAAGGGRPLAYALTGVAMLVLLVSILLPAGGADSPVPRDVARPARSMVNPASLFRRADYPAEALARRAQGSTRYRLLINKSGRAEACEILDSSGSAALDRATCRIMIDRSQFSPALDSSGRPVPASFSGVIRWLLPE